jgi:hypothetical protein
MENNIVYSGPNPGFRADFGSLTLLVGQGGRCTQGSMQKVRL